MLAFEGAFGLFFNLIIIIMFAYIPCNYGV
jgi:hypothetical protein